MEGFFAKKLAAKGSLRFLQKSSTIVFRVGSKYGSWQLCQKISHLEEISQLYKTFYVFVLIMQILFCQTNQKNLLQKGMKD